MFRAPEHVETVIIGAGQAGLSTAYHLSQQGRSFLILEAHARVGDVWRERFDSLRLYSPAKYDGLPGWPMPLDPWTYPGRDEVAEYLEAYAARFAFPVVTGARVDGLRRDGDGFVVSHGGDEARADNVVIASGTFAKPIVPSFADELDPRIVQLHSADYRNPGQIPEGPVLVVGASHSGADIALELSGAHDVVLSGRFNGEVPFAIEGNAARRIIPVLFFLATRVLKVSNPLGRKMREHERAHGGPLLRVKRAHLEAAGVDRTEVRVAGARDGLPVLDDGRVLDVASVVWCTGFGPDVGWIDLPVLGGDGWPAQEGGVVPGVPGLYFVGVPFLTAFASMLIGGVGRDGARVARHIAARAPARPAVPQPA